MSSQGILLNSIHALQYSIRCFFSPLNLIPLLYVLHFHPPQSRLLGYILEMIILSLPWMEFYPKQPLMPLHQKFQTRSNSSSPLSYECDVLKRACQYLRFLQFRHSPSSLVMNHQPFHGSERWQIHYIPSRRFGPCSIPPLSPASPHSFQCELSY